MQKTFLFALIASAVLFSSLRPMDKHNQLTKAEKKAGWELLFDGKSMKGWRAFKNRPCSSWEVVNGELHCKPSVKGGTDQHSDILFDKAYGNFELSIDWKISKAGNSGIIYHVSEDHDAPYLTGPEYQLIDDLGYPDKLEDWQKSGADYAMYAPASIAAKPVGEYNHTKIIFKDGHVEHWLNGVKVVEFQAWTDDWKARKAISKWKDEAGYGMNKAGMLDLQDHGSEIWFRDIKIRPL